MVTCVLCGSGNLVIGNWSLGEELADAVGELRSVASPVVDTVALEQDGGRSGARVVGSDDLDGTAVAGAVFLNDDNAVVGLLARSNARQTDHQHLAEPFKTGL